jgi:RHS repeat-associated protein
LIVRPDAADRIVTVADPNKSQPYASNIQYAASGAITQMTFGNSRTEARDLNPRLQTQMIALCPGSSCGSRTQPLQPSTQNLLNLQFGYYSNGNPQSQTISALGTFSITQAYSYDGLNRLNTTGESRIVNNQEAGWSQTSNYDSASLGNRWVTHTPGFPNMWPPGFSVSTFTPTVSGNYSSATNQINVSSPATVHDPAGNQTNIGAFAFTYDAVGRMTSATLDTQARTQFVYDGEGQRVMKLVCPNASPCTPAATGATQIVYVYDATGNLAAEYSNAAANTPCTTCYVTVDQLGSTRLLTDASGNVVRRYDYLPFGEEIPADGTTRTATNGYQSAWDGFTLKFTGQVRDTETGLDFMHARYYSPAQGRFISADPGNAGADPSDPQTSNGYSYVANNPLLYVDPLGLQASYSSSGSGDAAGSSNPYFSWGWTTFEPGPAFYGPFVGVLATAGARINQLTNTAYSLTDIGLNYIRNILGNIGYHHGC